MTKKYEYKITYRVGDVEFYTEDYIKVKGDSIQDISKDISEIERTHTIISISNTKF